MVRKKLHLKVGHFLALALIQSFQCCENGCPSTWLDFNGDLC